MILGIGLSLRRVNMSDLNQRAFAYYRYFLAIKLHFKDPKFDFFKNAGKTRTSISAYNGRNDRYFFEKAAKIWNTEKFLDKCLTQVKVDVNFSSKDLFTPDNESRYLKRKGYLESFVQALDKESSLVISESLREGIDNYRLINGSEVQKPYIYTLLKKGIISEETFLCWDGMLDVSPSLATFLIDPLVSDTLFFLDKYKPFVLKYFPPKKIREEIIFKTIDLIKDK